jgi:hypothetical protein
MPDADRSVGAPRVMLPWLVMVVKIAEVVEVLVFLGAPTLLSAGKLVWLDLVSQVST